MRWLFGVMWGVLLVDLLVWSPPAAPDQLAWIQDVFLGRWEGKNPATVALFNVMGLWPLAFASRLALELRARPIPAWPFVVGSMFIGAFALLPYLILRPSAPPPVPPGPWLRWLQHPAFRGGVWMMGACLVSWGLLAGDGAAFWDAYQQEQLVHVMSADCALLMVTMIVLYRR